MGDRIVVMRDGRIQQTDTPLNLYNHPRNQFVAGFIGSPSMNFFHGQLHARADGLVFDEGNIQLELPDTYKLPLQGYVGKEVVMGIRPEEIHDPDSVGRGLTTLEVKATVEVVEPMGNEALLYKTTGKSSFVARVDPQHLPVVAQEVTLAVEIGKVHFFDRDSEASLL